METIHFTGLEAVDTDSIPEPQRGGRGGGKYFTILTNFVDSGQEAALVHFDGDPKLSTVSAYMRKLINREGWNVSVLNRQGNLYLVRNDG
jgi:hypothetical protein